MCFWAVAPESRPWPRHREVHDSVLCHFKSRVKGFGRLAFTGLRISSPVERLAWQIMRLSVLQRLSLSRLDMLYLSAGLLRACPATPTRRIRICTRDRYFLCTGRSRVKEWELKGTRTKPNLGHPNKSCTREPQHLPQCKKTSITSKARGKSDETPRAHDMHVVLLVWYDFWPSFRVGIGEQLIGFT